MTGRPKHVRRRPVDPMAAGLTLAIILGGTLGVVAGARSVTEPEPSRALRAAPPTTIVAPAVRGVGTVRTPPPAIPSAAGPWPGGGRTVPTVRGGGPRAGAVPPAASDPTTTTTVAPTSSTRAKRGPKP